MQLSYHTRDCPWILKVRIMLKFQSTSHSWPSPAAVVADGDEVQDGDSEDAQGQGNDDNVEHFELWGEEGRKKKEVDFKDIYFLNKASLIQLNSI